jgi:hypothetical protein
MNCEWLRAATAFDCTPVRGLHNEAGVEIGTPFSYADGTAIVLYAMDAGTHVLLSDNGEMLGHLSAVGLRLDRRLPLLRDKLAPYGVTLTPQGDVRALVPTGQGSQAVSMMITALLSIAEWEREQLSVDEPTRHLVDEAELLLRAWRPNVPLERHARILGQSDRTHTFAFLLGDEFIDVITPNHTATGATMRKVGDVKNSPHLNGRDIRIVIDDRRYPQRAEVERKILGSFVKAMRMTKLQELAGVSRTTH